MKHLHTIVVDKSDLARLRGGETIELVTNPPTVLVYEGTLHKRRANGREEFLTDEEKVEQRREKKRLYMAKWTAEHRAKKNGGTPTPDLTPVQIMRQSKPMTNGKYRCRVCHEQYDSWPQLRGHLGKHVSLKRGDA